MLDKNLLLWLWLLIIVHQYTVRQSRPGDPPPSTLPLSNILSTPLLLSKQHQWWYDLEYCTIL